MLAMQKHLSKLVATALFAAGVVSICSLTSFASLLENKQNLH